MDKINSTKVTAQGKKNTNSVRINIPAVIRDTLEIKPGDSLVMECYIDNGKKLAIMKKQED
ncbi:AbrB/MazE/SpoVT family DNA-binding domain-containing protein [Methanosphaera sp.]|uniref:AbrB/MazE/SpoVT family DNA-binding domain-containing protein n=1 Tax=Methanosphaera sp. TaxID=2666342 RepID=UPI003D9288D3